MKLRILFILLFGFNSVFTYSQNSMVGDGFGGRLWYNPTNYTVGSYSAYSICYDICGSGETQLYGWGSNNSNQLGLGIAISGVNVPTLIPNTNNVRYYSTGYIMGAIKNDNTGWAWGNNISGNPIQVITDAYFLDASSGTTSFVKLDGTVWSIGFNSFGQFGDGTTNDSYTLPKQMQNINNAVRVANSPYTTVVLLSDSTLQVVGSDAGLGALGLGPSITSTYTPLTISGIPKIIDIKSNAGETIALTADGKVYRWGTDLYNFTIQNTPILIPNLNNIVAISGCDDGYHFMALDSAQNCYGWGWNWGQFGIPSTNLNTSNPSIVATNVIDIMAGETFSYLVKNDGSLWASGLGSAGNASIWLNLSDITREEFTELDPSQLPGACELVGITATTTNCDSINYGSISVNNFGGQSPFTYSIGGTFQSSNIFDSLSAGSYTITVQDANGCEYSTVTTINGTNCQYVPPVIPPEPDNSFITFPNVFSPDNDSENDYFFFPNEGLTEINCKVFDRWGLLMYEWNTITGNWNGKNTDGKSCPEGTYYYVVSYSLNNSNTKTAHGYISLFR